MNAERRMQSAELWDLRSANLSDLVGADIKSDTTDIIHSQRKALKMQNAECRNVCTVGDGVLDVP